MSQGEIIEQLGRSHHTALMVLVMQGSLAAVPHACIITLPSFLCHSQPSVINVRYINDTDVRGKSKGRVVLRKEKLHLYY